MTGAERQSSASCTTTKLVPHPAHTWTGRQRFCAAFNGHTLCGMPPDLRLASVLVPYGHEHMNSRKRDETRRRGVAFVRLPELPPVVLAGHKGRPIRAKRIRPAPRSADAPDTSDTLERAADCDPSSCGAPMTEQCGSPSCSCLPAPQPTSAWLPVLMHTGSTMWRGSTMITSATNLASPTALATSTTLATPYNPAVLSTPIAWWSPPPIVRTESRTPSVITTYVVSHAAAIFLTT
ncbi:hypothetical protein K488DRAFT_89237 [Vararia minispora EC-137]|uniref:Uncharacterized protein n=1 Tax=Vararia minispora EC-137 TaxID=1314806 RepID=A0ACB8QBC4_9AGAM|nr:hypothetical protein K488DRAFT_89237 [Vararia minispora EC-137]